MTRIDIVEEEESFSDNSSTASCNTTDEVQDSAIENNNDIESIEQAIERFQLEQLETEAAQEYYRYCQYYYNHINLEIDEEDSDHEKALSQEEDSNQARFRQQLASSVLSYILKLTEKLNLQRSVTQYQDAMPEDLNLRPKFAILKHKPEILGSSSSGRANGSIKQANQTPEWYFNMPDTLSPFPDFASKSTDKQDK